MAIIRRIPWTRQPPPGTPINWRNPITRGLKFFATSNRGVPWEEVRNERGTFSSGSGIIEPTDRGLAMEQPLNTASAQIQFPKHDEIWSGLSEITIMVYAKNRKGLIASSGAEDPMAHSGGGADDPWNIRWAGTENWLSVVNTGTADYIDSITDALHETDGVDPRNWNILGATWGNNLLVGRVNRTKSSGTVTVGTMVVSGNAGNQIYIGNSTATGNNSWDGWVNFGAVWNRALSDAEWNSMVDYPWQLWQPRTQIIPTEVAADGVTFLPYFPKRPDVLLRM